MDSSVLITSQPEIATSNRKPHDVCSRKVFLEWKHSIPNIEDMANKESIGSSGSAGSRVGHTILHSVHNGLVKVSGVQ